MSDVGPAPAEPITATGAAPRNVDGQAIAITVLTVRAPNQWFWGFALFVAVSLVLVVVPCNMRFSVDRWQGRA